MLFSNLQLATMAEGRPYGLIADGALLADGDRIVWAGPRRDAPKDMDGEDMDCGGRLLTPGLIDCHTHLVYGGNRANEFEQRLNGVAYADIAKAGGGILSTVRATRAASEEELLRSASSRLRCLLAEGVTTIEIKSGYGLDVETEMKMLRVARSLGRHHPVDVVTSYLGAHAFPAEYRDDHAAYVDLVCDRALPAVAGAKLADAVDAFCESIAFSVAETEKVFAAARALELPVKLHAEQLSDLGGARLAARHGALSVDHIEYLDEDGVAAIAASGTIAVLLPGAFYYLKEKQHPPVATLRRHQVPIAVATDLNPGSSPVHSLLAAMNMACVLFGLTPEEALRGVTVNAARALGLRDRGVIAAGMKADFVLWDAERPGDLAYPLGCNPCAAVIRNGRIVRGGVR
ncbi:MAG: imidazolonepropionase [Parvibaculaceae bacterium]